MISKDTELSLASLVSENKLFGLGNSQKGFPNLFYTIPDFLFASTPTVAAMGSPVF